MDFDEVVESLKRVDEFAYDIETTGLSMMTDRITGVALGWADPLSEEVESVYVDFLNSAASCSATFVEFKRKMSPILLDPSKRMVVHNSCFDIPFSIKNEIEFEVEIVDTMIAAHLLRPKYGVSYGLKQSVKREFGYEMRKFEETSGSGLTLFPDDFADYASDDAEWTLKLWHQYKSELEEKKKFKKYFENISLPLLPVLWEMKNVGFKVDRHLLSSIDKNLQRRIQEIEERVTDYDDVPDGIKLGSSKQLSQVLYNHLDLPTDGIERGVSGRYSTDKYSMEKLQDKHPLPKDVLEYRTYTKLKSTYSEPLIEYSQYDSRIRCNLNPAGTISGRLSSSNPNLQNQPNVKDRSIDIRRAFVPSEGMLLVAADYSQLELRMMAHCSGDKGLVEAYKTGKDVHSQTAAAVFDKDISGVTPDERGIGKTLNFTLLYQAGWRRLMQEADFTAPQARRYHRKWWETKPGVQSFYDKVKKIVAKKRKVKTICGRERHFKESKDIGDLVRFAGNHVIQGSSNDVMTLAMRDTQKMRGRKNYDANMLLQIHDEIVFEVPISQVKQFCYDVRSVMNSVVDLRIPLETDVAVSDNWSDSKKDKYEIDFGTDVENSDYPELVEEVSNG